MRVLILGGTTEASALCRALEDAPPFRPVLSLAGRTRAPALPAIPSRRGGFGGAAGLAAFLRAEGIGALVDATHPFAARMHANAAEAAREAGVPRLAVLRPAWRPVAGDRWTEVASMEAAAAALGPLPRRVFLTVGQGEVAAFRAAPWHDYLLRSVEPPDETALPHRVRCVAARGPFREDGERALLLSEGIEVIVSKNSGGAAVAPKLAAARDLNLPVVMVARPLPPEPPVVDGVPAALDWLRAQAAHPGALRGV